jgi:hypothetical protein
MMPTFRALAYADLPPSFQKWLAQDHGLSPLRAIVAAYFRRKPRQC